MSARSRFKSGIVTAASDEDGQVQQAGDVQPDPSRPQGRQSAFQRKAPAPNPSPEMASTSHGSRQEGGQRREWGGNDRRSSFRSQSQDSPPPSRIDASPAKVPARTTLDSVVDAVSAFRGLGVDEREALRAKCRSDRSEFTKVNAIYAKEVAPAIASAGESLSSASVPSFSMVGPGGKAIIRPVGDTPGIGLLANTVLIRENNPNYIPDQVMEQGQEQQEQGSDQPNQEQGPASRKVQPR